MRQGSLSVCAALLLAGCTLLPGSGPDPSPTPEPVPVRDGFTSLRDFATVANESAWGCEATSALDEQATQSRLTEMGYATMTCGEDGRLTIWASDATREEMSKKPPFILNPDFCHVDSANWTARGTPEMTRRLRSALGVTGQENCAIP